ncbi:leucine-rich repeat and coiled-coil domain-containing protein 1-like isoform X1 [Amphibalanus amphitrite]|uniref:leucine-rich repeat and coiled-coil domain-containing protein 1-like isoform X1 n=1 Tax=Amphibalanus amphitrite TaxID=1232801 RepID=UPI001C925C42|nr:leucine-rich repeat and coiled-coil domain-containing protein 1-like isoform X1 [Amphibalanus amphitrite]XP_043189234.1 leucine-rich repeat and coiled-coil domain-containing protein 1-like isoform X1 [Amphibalanus amphitrite]XP_043189235.1 leucine-rich repeat and coiled-coil domain-containing protein 1-like isoform X1 [Amphibalanus amphitrite]
MWNENSGSLPDPDTLIQFLLTPMNKTGAEETVPKKNESKCRSVDRCRRQGDESGGSTPAPAPAPSPAAESDDCVRSRIQRLERQLEAIRASQQAAASRSPSPPVREKRVTFAVSNSERSASESEADTAAGDVHSDPDVMAMLTPQACKLCSAYAQRYREEQRERVKQEVTSATLGQALCAAEAERDKLKAGLGHIQNEIQRMKEETVRLEGSRDKTVRELRRSEEDRSDLQLKLKVMSECVRKRDLELSIQRQALDDRDRRMKDAQSEGHATTNKLLVAQEQLQQLRTEHAAQTQKITELKDLLAEREKQHMAEMKKKHCADNPAVQKLIIKAADEARTAALKEAAAARAKAERETAQLRKDNERMTAALAKFKERFTELADDKSAALEKMERQKRQLDEAAAAAKQKDQKIGELNQTLKSVREEIEKLEAQRKADQTAHSAAVAFLENKVKQQTAAQDLIAKEIADAEHVKKQLEEAEKRLSEETTLRRAGDARLSVLKKQLDEMTAEHTAGLGKLQKQLEEARAELAKSKEAVAAKEKQVTSVTDQLRQTKQAAAAAAAAHNASRGRGDASSELETEKRRSHRLQVELDRLTENKAQLISRLEHAERELDRCAKKNEGWSKLWEEKVELIRKLESQVKMGRSMNDDKVVNLRHERDRAMDLAKQAAKKLQTLDSEYQAKMDEMHALFEAQLDGVRAAKDHELKKSAERAQQIEQMLREVSAETAASRSSLEDKMRRIHLITQSFEP